MGAIAPQNNTELPIKSPNKHSSEAKAAFLSSDDEEIDSKESTTAANEVKKKRKKPVLVYSGMKHLLSLRFIYKFHDFFLFFFYLKFFK